MLFADPRAVACFPSDSGLCLYDNEQRVLATAIEYHEGDREWWGVCSHRSGIPIDKRASSFQEAKALLMRTVWTAKIGVERAEYGYYDEPSKTAHLYMRSLTNEEVLEAARTYGSPAHQRIEAYIRAATGLVELNPSWVTHACAEIAYMRDVMDAQEMDWICR